MQQANTKTAAVLGLGMMGATLAKLLLEQGYQVTVWNRSTDKSAPLAAAGAQVADSPANAVNAASVIVMCVHDYAAAEAILAQTLQADWNHKVLIQLTSGSPAEANARSNGQKASAPGISTAPSRPLRNRWAGKTRRCISLVKPRPGAGPAGPESLCRHAGMAGYPRGARLLGRPRHAVGHLRHAHGLLPRRPDHGACRLPGRKIRRLADRDPQHLRRLHQIRRATRARQPIRQVRKPLSISVDATARILQAQDAGINRAFPAYLAGMFKQAADMGLAGEELSAMIKVLRAA